MSTLDAPQTSNASPIRYDGRVLSAVSVPGKDFWAYRHEPYAQKIGVYIRIHVVNGDLRLYLGRGTRERGMWKRVYEGLGNHLRGVPTPYRVIFLFDRYNALDEEDCIVLEAALIQLGKQNLPESVTNRNKHRIRYGSHRMQRIVNFMEELPRALAELGVPLAEDVKHVKPVFQRVVRRIPNPECTTDLRRLHRFEFLTDSWAEGDTVILPVTDPEFRTLMRIGHISPSLPLDQEHRKHLRFVAFYLKESGRAITHIARISRIEPAMVGSRRGPCRIVWDGPVTPIFPVESTATSTARMDRPRYALAKNLLNASNVDRVWPKHEPLPGQGATV